MTRDEVARLLRTCWRYREVQEGKPTDKRPLRHLVRVILIGVYTGSRPGAILNASWRQGPGLSFVDTVNGVFHRHADGRTETTKRQPTVRLAPRLLAHMRRWERLDVGQTHIIRWRGQKVLSIKTAIHTACKLAGVDPVTAYTLRHTAASWLVSRGLSTRKVADFIGTGEQMVLSHYGHLSPDYQDEAAQMIGRTPGANCGAGFEVGVKVG
jgi:integrase